MGYPFGYKRLNGSGNIASFTTTMYSNADVLQYNGLYKFTFASETQPTFLFNIASQSGTSSTYGTGNSPYKGYLFAGPSLSGGTFITNIYTFNFASSVWMQTSTPAASANSTSTCCGSSAQAIYFPNFGTNPGPGTFPIPIQKLMFASETCTSAVNYLPMSHSQYSTLYWPVTSPGAMYFQLLYDSNYDADVNIRKMNFASDLYINAISATTGNDDHIGHLSASEISLYILNGYYWVDNLTMNYVKKFNFADESTYHSLTSFSPYTQFGFMPGACSRYNEYIYGGQNNSSSTIITFTISKYSYISEIFKADITYLQQGGSNQSQWAYGNNGQFNY